MEVKRLIARQETKKNRVLCLCSHVACVKQSIWIELTEA